MKYSKQTAQKLAKQIRDRFGLKIARAVEGTPVPQKFVAGLISVEAGKKDGQITETATRFEPHVFAKLQQVRDGSLLQYNKIRKSHLLDATDDALKALSKSYGLTQVMGWWSIHLGDTVAQIRDPETHLNYAVKLMILNSTGDFERGEYVGELKQWNSGSETGKTHDPDYVFNAGSVMDAYEELGDVDNDFRSEPLEPPDSGGPAKTEETEQNPEPPAAPHDEKPEAKPDEANTVTVQKVTQSLGSKLMASGTLVGTVVTGLVGALLGIIKNPYAFSILIVGGAALAIYSWNQSKNRQLKLQMDLNAKAASRDLNTVVVSPPPPKT